MTPELSSLPGPYSPGSFTKNYGWSGKGFLRLHEAISAGFSGKLAPVDRTNWRSAAQLSDTQFLLTANFFLHSVRSGKENFVVIDEFVRQAIMEPHSLAFDRLALFVFNLSLGGLRSGDISGEEFPALWANQFVREVLWSEGRWRRNALDESMMDGFIGSRIIGVPDVKVKCRTNYRHMFEIVNYLPSSNSVINTDPESWIASALFTAWDRRALSFGSAASKQASSFIEESLKAEDFKLLGVTVDEFRTLAEPIAHQYVSVDGLERFYAQNLYAPMTPANVSTGISSSALSTPSVAEELGWLTAAGSDEAVERAISKRLTQKRDRILATKLKRLYEHRCMACENALIIGLDPERRHAEAAHIRPLGSPYNGPDKPSNIIVLCPSHHIQFDRGILSLKPSVNGVIFVSRILGDPLNNKVIAFHPKHELDPECVNWHNTMYATVGK